MNIVLCQINSKYIHSSLAVWYLAAGLEKYSKSEHICSIVEGTINENIDSILERIFSFKPDLIGFSCYIWNINYIKELGEKIKQILPNIIIVLGGPEVSYNQSESLLKYEWCNYLISGEGEKPFAKLCDSIEEYSICNTDGICYRKNKEIIISNPFVDTEDPPSPYTNQYFEHLNGRIVYLETSRGCPFRCAFCLSGRCGGVRFFDFDNAISQAILLSNSGTKTIKLVDRTFNANPSRAKRFWKFIISEYGKKIPKNICFHFEIAGDILDDESIQILSKANRGFIQLEIGFQSFNEETLSKINRKTSISKLEDNIKKLVSLRNMNIHIDLIVGLPFEGIESFKSSFNKAYYLYTDMLQVGFLKLLHGADMREMPKIFPCDYSKDPPYEIIRNEWITEKDINDIHKLEDALERLYNSSRFKSTLAYVIEKSNQTPYDIYMSFGKWLVGKSRYDISLDDYSKLVFDYFCTIPSINVNKLKDMMIIDRLSSNASGKTPEFLKVKRNIIKKVRTLFEKKYPNEYKNLNKGFALLASDDIAIISNYDIIDPVTKLYPYKLVPYNIKEVDNLIL